MGIDLRARIIPDRSLGGLELRTPILQLGDLLRGLGVSRKGSYELVNVYEARYSLGDGSVCSCFDVRNGKLFKLIATNNYKGSFQGRIYVGQVVEEAMHADPRLYYWQPEECILCHSENGIRFEVPITDPDPSDVPSLRISSIVVYATEIETIQGQEGKW